MAGPLSDLTAFLADHAHDGSPARAVDVTLLAENGAMVSGHPSRVAPEQIVLTAQGAMPGAGDDTAVDPRAAVWAWVRLGDGTAQTFGADEATLSRVLDVALATAKATDPNGADVARLHVALGVLAHARQELRGADRAFRTALRILSGGGADRAQGDLWMRLAGVYRQMGQPENATMCLDQAVSTYTSALGAEHAVTAYAMAARAATS